MNLRNTGYYSFCTPSLSILYKILNHVYSRHRIRNSLIISQSFSQSDEIIYISSFQYFFRRFGETSKANFGRSFGPKSHVSFQKCMGPCYFGNIIYICIYF